MNKSQKSVNPFPDKQENRRQAHIKAAKDLTFKSCYIETSVVLFYIHSMGSTVHPSTQSAQLNLEYNTSNPLANDQTTIWW